MTGALALVAALSLSSQIQTHPAGLDSIGPSRARSLRTAPIMDKLYQQANKPALDFNFARFKDLHDDATGKTSVVTFSRSAAQSPGTYVGADGLIHDAAVNLALYSEQFDNAWWLKYNIGTLPNQTTSPDGKQTADLIYPTASGSFASARILRGVSLSAGIYTISFYAKSAGKDWVYVTAAQAASSNDNCWVNISTGQIGTTGSNVTASTENVGNGWYRVNITGPADGSSDYIYISAVDSNGSSSVTANGTDGLYIWGAQLQEGTTATPYIHTTSQALAAPRFDHDPVTGESLGLLVEEQRANLFLNSATLATQTVTTTAAEHTLSFYGTGTVDLTGTHTATVVGTGAYPARTTLTFTPTAGSLTATVTGTVEFAQLEAGSFPTSYIPTSGSAQTRYADIAAVQDEDFATTNLLAYSESFDVGWTAVGATVAANDIVAPDGLATADKIVESSGGTSHFVETQSVSFSAATHTVSVYAKYNGRQFLTMQGTSARIGANVASFDLSDGSVAFASAGTSASISDEGNGWYRLQWSVSATAGTGTIGFFLADQSGVRDDTYSGDGASGIYLWGASLTATEYPVAYTTTRNLLTDSQDFERSTWVKAAATIDNDVAQAPDGTLTADKIVEDFATSAHYVMQNNVTYVSGVTYSISNYLKAGERTKAYVYMPSPMFSASDRFALLDLNAGTYTHSGAGTVTMTDAGNGWWRVVLTITAVASGTSYGNSVNLADASGTLTYTGDGTSGLYRWGAQLEPGTTATDYVRTVDTVGKAYGFYEPTEGTVFVDVTESNNNIGRVLNVFGGSSRIVDLNRNYGNWEYFKSSDSSTTTIGSYAEPSLISVAIKLDDYNSAANGSVGTPDTSTGQIPSADLLRIGDRFDGARTLNGHIKRLTYWPVRQSDSTLQVITQ